MADSANHPLGEALDRREHVRLIVSLPGRLILTNRRAAGGSHPESACRVVNISPGGMLISAQTSVSQGEPLAVHASEFGVLQGGVIRSLANGFAMNMTLSEERRDWLAAKLAWMERKQSNAVRDLRRHARRIPRNNRSTLMLADGSITLCHIIDMSCSGVAVHTSITPPIHTPLAIGKVVGRVVRQFDNGCAVQFINAQDDKFLEKMLLVAEAGLSGLSLGDFIVPAENPMTPRAHSAPR